MARRFRFLSLTLALGVLPLPGCTASWAVRVPPPPVTGVPDRPPDASPTAEVPSPYHTVADGGVRDEGTRATLDRTGYNRPDVRPRPQPEPQEAPPQPQLEPVPSHPEILAVARAPEEPLVAALRCYLNKQPDEAVEILNRYDAKNQEMLLRLLPLVVRCTEGSLGNATPQELATLMEELDKVAEPVRALAPLEITRMVFCQRINGFGAYVPLEGTPTFRAACPGQPGERVQVYAEVRNFKSKVRPDGQYATTLASKVEIRDLHDKLIWSYKFDSKDDASRTPRQDYFINYRFDIPANLTPGHYVLSIEVEDVLSDAHRPTAKSYDFMVK
jgi:hypothetical protein